MTPSHFINYLQRQGVTLAANGDRLSVKAKPGVLTWFELEQLQAMKPQLISELLRPSGESPGSPPAHSGELESVASILTRTMLTRDVYNPWDGVAHTIAHANTATHLTPAERAKLLDEAALTIERLEPATVAKGESY